MVQIETGQGNMVVPLRLISILSSLAALAALVSAIIATANDLPSLANWGAFAESAIIAVVCEAVAQALQLLQDIRRKISSPEPASTPGKTPDGVG